MSDMPKTYSPAAEAELYAAWEGAGAFHAEINPAKTPFTIVIPPPNITGQLHMGHALDCTLQDILIRYKRMAGYEALWMPGTDHAAIATEVKIVQAMAEEGVTKSDLGRDGFLERAWQWKEQYGGRITHQLRRLGASCDWQRERFTMDEGCSKAVREAFVRLYEKGLIYRGNRIIHWCPECKTALSDAEVEYEPHAGHLWHIRYPLAEGEGGITVATTRPETMMGDTAVAVHPDDERYAALVGKQLILPLTGRTIPVVADDYVEREFGSGAVKITPAHDSNDYQVAVRHDLPMPNIMNPDATMNALAGEAYEGLTREQCRERVVADLQAQGYLVRVEDYENNRGTCYRCGAVVEPRLSLQWFVDMKPLAGPAIDAVRKGATNFVPERFSKTYFHWLENIRDWCISRQLWWGHRIPAWHCACGETVVSREDPTTCPKCGGALEQDQDVLDTWFSSGLWPFSTMGWPEKTPELDYFYPTNTLVTGYDIITFWVLRMVFMAEEYTGQAPFDTVLIHGLVRDEQGRKMSKSLGNGIDPLQIIDEFGADALRCALITGLAQGGDMRFSRERVQSARNLCNKLWNATRFVLQAADPSGEPSPDTLPIRWLRARCAQVAAEVTAKMESLDLGLAMDMVVSFMWDEFCDWAIEFAKPVLYGDDAAAKSAMSRALIDVLTDTLKLLHPFMPFITEGLYQNLPNAEGFLMSAAWPSPTADGQAAIDSMNRVMEAVRAVRNLRAVRNVPPGRMTSAMILCEPEATEQLREGLPFALKLASLTGFEFVEQSPEGCAVAVCPGTQIFLPLGELVDMEAEKARLEKELASIQKEATSLTARLANPDFTARAKPEVVTAARNRATELEGMQAAVQEQLAGM